MFRHYLRTAWRNIIKNKPVAFINILGLTVGIVSCMLIGLYIQHELSYDKFQQKGDRIVRLIMEYKFAGSQSNKGNYTSTKVLPAFMKEFPEVQQGVRMKAVNTIVTFDKKQFDEPQFLYADSTFFDLFSFKMVNGDPQKALSGLNKLVLTQTTAHKYFGYTDPIGRILQIGADKTPFQITGIIQDCPSNSQIQFDFLASFSSLGATQEFTYWDEDYTTYLLLRNKNNITSLQGKIPAFMQKEMQGQNAMINYHLEPFSSIHLHSPYDSFVPNISITYIYILGGIALLILAIVCFTYINLSTASSLERAREVGVRKAVGAYKTQIFWQFIGESMILTLLSLLLSILIVLILLPPFEQLTSVHLSLNVLLSPSIFVFSMAVIICISFVAGSYPALILSSFQPHIVLKGTWKSSGSSAWLRKLLVVFQFGISIFLITSTFVIQSQLHFIQNTKLGYDKGHIVILPASDEMRPIISTLKNEFMADPNIQSVSYTSQPPNNINGTFAIHSIEMPQNEQNTVTATAIDKDYLKTMGLQILTGSDLSESDMEDIQADSIHDRLYHYIVNESTVKQLGWTPEQAIGKRLSLGNQLRRPGIIKAVVKDFHFQSLHTPIGPLVLFPQDYSNHLLVKISGNHVPNTIQYLRGRWNNLIHSRPFEYKFLDSAYNKMYQNEIRLGKIMNLFSAIAIILACLGLFGLSAYAIRQRKKEIGVRKVLGASVKDISMLIFADFLKLVMLAFLIAVPLSWLSMRRWLNGYAYKISMPLWVFATTGVMVLIIALATLICQTLRAAKANPINSLKTE